MIVRHVLEHHFGVEAEEIKECQTQFDNALKLPERISGLLQDASVPTGFKAAIAAFDGLVRDIKSLDEALPLALLNVNPIDPHLRYTSAFAPTPLPAGLVPSFPSQARYLPSIEIILQFERSGQWPDDLGAIQTTKLAFFERIGSLLMEKIPGLRADVVVGDGYSTSDIIDQAYLQVVTVGGWAFSARIWHDREATLLQELAHEKRLPKRLPGSNAPTNDADGDSALKRKRASEALELYTRRFIHSPKHHRAIAALCHHFPAFPGTARLVKRWMSSHWLLGGHVTEEAVELLCATVFLNGSRQMGEEDHARPGTPGTKEVGFARVIAFLKEWMWEEGELFVPVYESNGGEEISETASESPSKIKAGSVSGVWTLITKEDPTGHMWTSRGPNALVARRIRALASATLDAIHGTLKGERNVKVRKTD
jgi:U3 small nucleolar RNA-associated protein 22